MPDITPDDFMPPQYGTSMHYPDCRISRYDHIARFCTPPSITFRRVGAVWTCWCDRLWCVKLGYGGGGDAFKEWHCLTPEDPELDKVDNMSTNEEITTAKIVAAGHSMQVIAETVVGYHKKLIDGGVPAETASRMAEEFHSALIEVMKTNATQSRPRR